MITQGFATFVPVSISATFRIDTQTASATSDTIIAATVSKKTYTATYISS